MSISSSSSSPLPLSLSPKSLLQFPSKPHQSLFPSKPTSKIPPLTQTPTKLFVSSSPPPKTLNPTQTPTFTGDGEELIFFDGGAHYGDLLANLLLGFTLFWLPLTIAAVSRAFFLRYRFTNRRVTVISGLTGGDRSDFPYSSVRDVQVVPRLIGEWGDIVITLKDGTKVDLRSVPKFREIADYCLLMANDGIKREEEKRDGGPRGF